MANDMIAMASNCE